MTHSIILSTFSSFFQPRFNENSESNQARPFSFHGKLGLFETPPPRGSRLTLISKPRGIAINSVYPFVCYSGCDGSRENIIRGYLYRNREKRTSSRFLSNRVYIPRRRFFLKGKTSAEMLPRCCRDASEKSSIIIAIEAIVMARYFLAYLLSSTSVNVEFAYNRTLFAKFSRLDV